MAKVSKFRQTPVDVWEIAPSDGLPDGDRFHVRRVDRAPIWFSRKQAEAMRDVLNDMEPAP